MKVWLAVGIAVLSLAVGMPVFWGYDAQDLTGLTNGITAIAAVVFGVLGVWMSVLRPADGLDDVTDDEDDEPDATDEEGESAKATLALELIPAFKQAIIVLVLATLFRLALVVLPLASGRLSDVFGYAVPAVVGQFGAAFSGAMVIFLYLFVVAVLFIAALPLLAIEEAEEARAFNRDEKSNRKRTPSGVRPRMRRKS